MIVDTGRNHRSVGHASRVVRTLELSRPHHEVIPLASNAVAFPNSLRYHRCHGTEWRAAIFSLQFPLEENVGNHLGRRLLCREFGRTLREASLPVAVGGTRCCRWLRSIRWSDGWPGDADAGEIRGLSQSGQGRCSCVMAAFVWSAEDRRETGIEDNVLSH